MRYLNLTSHIGLLLTLALLSACATTGEKLEAEGKYEEAMYAYAEAFKKDPTSNETRIRFLQTRQKAADMRFKTGMQFVEKGNHVDALPEFQAAMGIDPTQGRFNQQIEISTRYKDAQGAFTEGTKFEKENKLKDAHRQYIKATELFPDNQEYKTALERIVELRKSKLEGYELHLKSTKPITLKFKDAKIKDVFKILTQLSGINFVFDDGVKDTPISIFLENASFQQALDLLTDMNKLSTQNLNETTALVYQRTPDKSKQYENMMLRTFHLNYMEAKKAINLIRTMVQVRKAYVNEDSNSLVIRDTKDIVDVVEKILDANDMPEAEVVLDVEVIEVSDKNAQNIGLLLNPYNVQVGAFRNGNLMSTTLSAATSTPATTTTDTTGAAPTTTSTSIGNLVNAFNYRSFGAYVTVPNATFNFGKTLTKGEVLSNPKIRVKNKEKAKFNVGTRLPIVTTTVSSGTVSQASVQYVDVGVKLNAEPTIQLNNEITIKLSLEVSQQIGGTQNVSGASVVTIGTRNLDTVLSLKDGETSVIGGLREYRKSNGKNQIYLLSDIPLIGSLFTNSDTSKDKTELILAITPRLVRGVPVPLPGLDSFSSGKEDHPSLTRPMSSFDQEPVFEGEAEPEAAEKQTALPSALIEKKVLAVPALLPPVAQPAQAVEPVQKKTAPVLEQPAKTSEPVPITAPVSVTLTKPATVSKPAPAPLLAPVSKPVPVPAPTPVTATATATASKSAPEEVKRSILQIAAPSSASVGKQFSLDIKVSDVKDLATASFVLGYDPTFLDFVLISEGAFMKSDARSTAFTSKVDRVSGTVTVALAHTKKSSGVSGDGILATASFRAKNQGLATLDFKNSTFTSEKGATINILPFSTAVDIR